MFITKEDYIQIGEDALKIMQQNSEENRKRAEQRALSRIAAALGGRYDAKAAFAMENEERDAELVGCAVDIALYHMSASLPGRMGNDIRKEKYEKAIEYLKDIQNGRATPNVPTITGPSGEEDYHNPVRYGSATKNDYIW